MLRQVYEGYRTIKTVTWAGVAVLTVTPQLLLRWGLVRSGRRALHIHFVTIVAALLVGYYTHAGLFSLEGTVLMFVVWGKVANIRGDVLRGTACVAFAFFMALRYLEAAGHDPFRHADYITLEDYRREAPLLYAVLQHGACRFTTSVAIMATIARKFDRVQAEAEAKAKAKAEAKAQSQAPASVSSQSQVSAASPSRASSSSSECASCATRASSAKKTKPPPRRLFGMPILAGVNQVANLIMALQSLFLLQTLELYEGHRTGLTAVFVVSSIVCVAPSLLVWMKWTSARTAPVIDSCRALVQLGC